MPAAQPPPAPRRVLPVIVLAQLAGTSPWFAVNAVMPDLQREFGWPAAAVGTLTSAVQIGFIVGALVFALLSVAAGAKPGITSASTSSNLLATNLLAGFDGLAIERWHGSPP